MVDTIVIDNNFEICILKVKFLSVEMIHPCFFPSNKFSGFGGVLVLRRDHKTWHLEYKQKMANVFGSYSHKYA